MSWEDATGRRSGGNLIVTDKGLINMRGVQWRRYDRIDKDWRVLLTLFVFGGDKVPNWVRRTDWVSRHRRMSNYRKRSAIVTHTLIQSHRLYLDFPSFTIWFGNCTWYWHGNMFGRRVKAITGIANEGRRIQCRNSGEMIDRSHSIPRTSNGNYSRLWNG